MSWNKNTVSSSTIDNTLRVLKNTGQDFKLVEIGYVEGRGLNDDEGRGYKLRKLEYEDRVILERMIRQTDCDVDDRIESKEFLKGKEPLNWKTEITFDNETGNYVKGGNEKDD